MTVSTSTAKSGPYSGSGTTGPFTVTFRFLDNTHLQVIRTSTGGIDTTLTLTADYSVTGAGGSSGTVTLVAPLLTGEKLTIVRNVPLTQDTDYVPGDPFPAESHETALDKLTMITQQIKERVDSSLTIPPSASGVSTQLPNPAATQLIGWNNLGTALQNFDAGSLGVAVSYAQWRTQAFSGTGAQTAFVLTNDAGSASNIDLAVDGLTLAAGVDFTYNPVNRTITILTGAPPSGVNNVVARYGQALPLGVVDLADGSVSGAKLVDGAITTAKIGDQQVTLAKVQNIATARVLGRVTAGSGVIEELTATQVTASLVNDATEAAPGRIEISTTAEAQGGVDNTRAITPARLKDAQIRLATAVATISGTAIDFTGIPSWAKRVKLMLNGVSTNGTSNPLIQLGDSGGIEATGYLGAGTILSGAGSNNTSYTTGFGFPSALATNVLHGTVVFDLVDASTNTWACSGVLGLSGIAATAVFGGTKALSPGPLDRIRLTTVGGTDAFDAGNAAISWE